MLCLSIYFHSIRVCILFYHICLYSP